MPLERVTSAKPRLPKLRKSFVIERHEGQVGKTVVIEVAEIDAHSGNELRILGEGHAGLESHLLEFPAALVMEQEVIKLVVGDEDVHPAVQIVVRDSRSHSFARVRD
jgi:hypothetical protein